MKAKRSNYAVIGRIPFDDEDTCLTYNNVTRETAVERFHADMGVKPAAEEGEPTCYINHVLVSKSRIKDA